MHIRIFGSLAYAFTKPVSRTKLDSRPSKCDFIGFKTGVKGCILYDIFTNNVFLSHDVVHFDHIFPV